MDILVRLRSIVHLHRRTVRMTAHRFTLVAAFVLVPVATTAQQTLTLDDCLRKARENSIALRLTDHALHAGQLTETEIRSTALPQIKLSTGASYAPVSGSTGYDPTISNMGQVSGLVVVQESLFDGGIRGLRADQIALELERLSNQHRATDRDLVYAVTALFVEALRAQQEIVLQDLSVGQLEEYLSLVNQMMHGGAASRTDVLKTVVQLTNARLASAGAARDACLARAMLAEAMGNPSDTAFVVAGTLATPSAAVDEPMPDSVGESLDVTIGGLDLKKSLLDVEISKRERWPTFSLTGDLGWLTSVENLRLAQSERLPALGYSVGILMEVPLFTWGGIGSRVEQREAAAAAQQLGVEQISRSFRHAILSVRIQMQKREAALRASQSTIRAAEENYLLTKAKFAGGGTLSLDVLSAQQLLADSRLSELQSLAAWHTLNAKLHQLHTR
jgi:outer membrane protein TolC